MRFTVLTATYNRGATLARVYESLCAQTFRDFEWLIVDDGSTDNTKELVQSWKAFFPIRYLWKANGGKHTAWNLGVASAQGEFVLNFDSDDACVPNALERFDTGWRQIPHAERFAALGVRCRTPNGDLLGDPYLADCIDAFTLRELLHHGDGKEGWAMIRTDVLRQFPFPEGEPFVMEGLVWNRICQNYAVRLSNEPLLVVYPTPESLSRRGVQQLLSSPRMTRTYYWELLRAPVDWRMRARAAASLCWFSLLSAIHKVRSGSSGLQPRP